MINSIKIPSIINKTATALVVLIPLAYLVCAWLTEQLGANAVEKVLHTTGDWALNFIILAMAARTLSGLAWLKWLASYHRAAGLGVFFYATLHFLTYAAFEHNFSISEIISDAARHTRIIFGALAYMLTGVAVVMMLPAILRRIGFRRVRHLHKAAVYPAAIAAAVHYVWLVK